MACGPTGPPDARKFERTGRTDVLGFGPVPFAMETGLRAEATLFQLCFASGDGSEGLTAFLDKRAPLFRAQ